MQLRRLEISVVIVAGAAGAALGPGFMSDEAGRLLIIFLGLVSASILPTVSLIMGNMTASGRSIKALNDLNVELRAAMEALFVLFGSVGVAVAALLALALDPPSLFQQVPWLTSDILPRAGQAILLMASALIVGRAGVIPGILRRSLDVRHRIAVDEARRKTLDNAPARGDLKKSFATHPDFGKTVRIEDLNPGAEGRH